jgi:hypothetical protein
MNTLRKIRDSAGGHHDNDPTDIDVNENAVPGITDNSAFNADAQPELDGDVHLSKTDKLKEKLKGAKHAVAHPQQAAKARGQKLVQKVGMQTERPFLGDEVKADARLFRAYDERGDAREEHAKRPDEPGAALRVDQAEDRVEGLEEKRSELEMVWHLSRYVRRARVVRGPLDWPDRSNKERYGKFGSDGKFEGVKWIKWAGHVSRNTLC